MKPQSLGSRFAPRPTIPTYALILACFGLALNNACKSNETAGSSAETIQTSAVLQTNAATPSAPLLPTTSAAANEAPTGAVPATEPAASAAATALTPTPKPTRPSSSGKVENKVEKEPAPAEPATPTPAPAAAAAEASKVDKPCLGTSFEFGSVKSACEKGGVPKAKALMKSWTNKAKEKGEEYKCTSCHDNQRTYTNKPGAVDDLRKLLAVIK